MEIEAFEIEQLAADKSRPAQRARKLALLAFKAKTMRAYRRLLLDADGNLSSDALLVLADLTRASGMGKVRAGASAEELNFREGRRAMLLHLFARMDAGSLQTLARNMRETSENE